MNKNLVIFVCSAIIATQTISRGGGDFSPSVTVSVKIDKSEISVGEPLFVDLTITNKGTGDVRLSHSPDIGAVFVSKDNKRYEKFTDGMRPMGKTTPLVLGSGESVTSHFAVCYTTESDGGTGKGGYAFGDPGVYFIKGGCTISSSLSVYTEPVKIVVKEPVGTDLEVWSRLREIDAYGRLIQLPESPLPQEALDRLTELTKKHPASVYSSCVNTALAKRTARSNSK
jgi:hypothetical protein